MLLAYWHLGLMGLHKPAALYFTCFLIDGKAFVARSSSL